MEHVCMYGGATRCSPREAWSAELSLFLCRPQQPTGPPLSRLPQGLLVARLARLPTDGRWAITQLGKA